MKYVRLKDKGTIFHDASQDVSVTGSQIVKAKPTPKLEAGLKGGVIEEVSEEEYKAQKGETSKVTAKTDEKVETLKKELEAKDETYKADLKAKEEAHEADLKAKDAEIEELKKQLEAKATKPAAAATTK